MPRPDGRANDQLRPVTITRNWQAYAEGSALVEFGDTKVLCAASVQQGVPRWRKGSGLGWVTAEYAMLPRATLTRNDRESVQGQDRRPHARDLPADRPLAAGRDRPVGAGRELDLDRLRRAAGRRRHPHRGDHRRLRRAGRRGRVAGRARRARPAPDPLSASVAAVSVGVIDGEARLDLMYDEDVRAETDMNVVITGAGDFVEVQGTAEGAPFRRDELDALLDLAVAGCAELGRIQTGGAGRVNRDPAGQPQRQEAGGAAAHPRPGAARRRGGRPR